MRKLHLIYPRVLVWWCFESLPSRKSPFLIFCCIAFWGWFFLSVFPRNHLHSTFTSSFASDFVLIDDSELASCFHFRQLWFFQYVIIVFFSLSSFFFVPYSHIFITIVTASKSPLPHGHLNQHHHRSHYYNHCHHIFRHHSFTFH